MTACHKIYLHLLSLKRFYKDTSPRTVTDFSK